MICTSAIVATNIPVAVGAAYANKYHKNGKITAVFFGDGAIDEGVFWESINTASMMKLPLLFVCEDNGFAVHIPKEERHGYKSIHKVVDTFDCDVWELDSTDVEEIYNLAKKAIRQIKETGKPGFLHLKYYRYLEHVGVFEDFKANYRDKAEYEKWREKDPVELQRKKLFQWYSEEEIRAAEKEIDDQVLNSIAAAESAPFPSPEEAYKGVYA